MNTTSKFLLACLAALCAAAVQAGVGLTELPGLQGDGPVTVYYPTGAQEQAVKRAAFTLALAVDAPPQRGNSRLVVISHGSGGAPWVHADLARALVEDGFTVALSEHRHDNYRNHSDPGPPSWKLRPAEVSRAIDAMAADTRFGPLLALDKVGLFGGSAGGHTALSFAGGRWSPAGFRRHCEANIQNDFSSCVGYIMRLRGNFLDGLKKSVALRVIRQRFGDEGWYTHHDMRVAAAVAAVPFAADFDMASLAVPRIPLGLVSAGKDNNQVPRFHVGAVRAVCTSCESLADFPDASHGVMLSPAPPRELISDITHELNGDPPGFDRPAAITLFNQKTVQFFRKHLGAGQ